MNLKLTHLDWNPEATLIHFQGQYLTICELDYNILQREIQNAPKFKSAVDVGEFCLVEDLTSARWYRGRVQSKKEDLFDVFLIDHGNVLSVNAASISTCSDDLFSLPPKVVCGFLANVLLLQGSPVSVMEKYFSSLIGRNVTGYIQALLPHKVLLLETPEINIDLVRQGFGRHVDTDTFLLLVEMITEVQLKQNIEPVPDLLIEKPRGHECCLKLSGLRGYDDILTFCGPKLSCGTRAKVRVTAAVNSGLFYCQMASMEKDLWELSKKLAAACEHKSEESYQKTSENLGLLCAVKGKDDKWYRGFVQFLPVNSQVRVLFIDYGFFELIKVKNIHRLPLDFDSIPVMAFPCCLLSLNNEDEEDRAQQLSFLKQGLLGKVLNVEIRGIVNKQHAYSITVIDADDNYVEEAEAIQVSPQTMVGSVSETEQLPFQCGYLYHESVMRETLVKTLEAEEVQEGSVFVGYVEHVHNPHQFWMRTQKRNCAFEEMMADMRDYFRQMKLDEGVLLNPEVGALCCAVYEKDMHFYRGVITDVLEHGAEVFFVDFGNIEKVPHRLIKKMPDVFVGQPAFAFCCCLVNVLPLDEVWTGATCDFFRRAVSNKALLVHVIHIKKNKFAVDLCEMGSDINQSISGLMISSNQAEMWNNICIDTVKKNPDVIEKTRYCTNAETENCKEQKKTYNNETVKADVPSCFKGLSIESGSELAVCCSYLNSPSDFWCQPLNKKQALKELMDKVQLYYSVHTVALQSGDLWCVAKSPQDKKWYRAFIIEQQRSQARVILIDYGCTVQINERNIQGIIPEFTHLEGQAFRCSLYNLIEPVNPEDIGTWSAAACMLLKDFVHDSTSALRCKIFSQLNVNNVGLCNVVDLCNAQTQQSINNLLLEQGLAREVIISTEQQFTRCPDTFVFSSFDLNPGQNEQIYVTHVNSQWEFYCQLEQNADLIEELEEKIAVASEQNMQASSQGVIRKLCLAKYFDGKWYRALACPVQSPLYLSVFFVDYGNTNISEKEHVMPIPTDSADLFHTPMQAVRCSLDSVTKDEVYPDVKEWLKDTILNKQVRAHIVSRNEDGSFDVELFDGELNINQKVKELIASLLLKPKSVGSLGMNIAETKQIALHGRQIETSVKNKVQSERDASPSNTQRGSHVDSPKKESCKSDKKYNVQGKALTSKKVNLQKESQTKSGVHVKPKHKAKVKEQSKSCDTNTKSEQRKFVQKTDTPQLSHLPQTKVTKGCKALCFVSHANSVTSFFLQMSDDEPDILKMVEDLNSSFLRESLKEATSLRVSDVVLAEYEEDGALYRSAVKDCEGNSSFNVEFVDYGNSAVVEKEKMYSIPKEYLSQPRFSILCSLLDFRPYNNDASFIDAVMGKPLMVDFLCQLGTKWLVKVEILDEADDPSLPPEAPVEIDTKHEKKETASASLCEKEGTVSFGEEDELRNEDVNEKVMITCERVPTDNGEKPVLKTPHSTPLTRKSVICRCHRRTRSRIKSNLKERKIIKFTGKLRTACAKVVMPLMTESKDTENCTVLSVQAGGTFFARLNRTSGLLSAVESHIVDNIHKCEMVAEEDVKQGLKCLVQLDGKERWHRAVVHKVCQGKCQVLLEDHGVTEEISISSIRQESLNLRSVQSLAFLCRMNAEGFSEREDAHELWCETLKPMIGKEVKLVFGSFSEAEKVWNVEMIINRPLFIHQTSLPANNIVPSHSEVQKETEEAESSLDTRQPHQLSFAPIYLNKAYSGFATAVTTPFEFYVVLEDSLLVMSKVSTMLDGLPQQMSPLPEAHLAPGTSCLFKSDAKKKWCRAEIVHLDTTAILNLVDHGHQEGVPCTELKRLPLEMMKLPKLAHPCSLRGVMPVTPDGQWSDEAEFYFQQCLYEKNLQIFFREFVSDTHWKVDILTDDVHVAQELVDAGHASYIDIMLELRYASTSFIVKNS